MLMPKRPNLQRVRLHCQLSNGPVLQRLCKEMYLPIRTILERKHLCVLLWRTNLELNIEHLHLPHRKHLERILML
jgi:hypothetical protein